MKASIRASSLEIEGKRRTKCESKEDFISALPDCLIHHILSFLPTTRDAIRTGLLSKRWLHQWTHVPILIFNPKPGMSSGNFSDFIDKALSVYNNCSKIKKFVIDSEGISLDDLGDKLATWILFAAARDVKELTLDHAVNFFEPWENYHVPQSLIQTASLVKFRANCCAFMPEGNVNWESLKALYIGYSHLPNQVMKNVLSGCPVIEFLELCTCDGFGDLAIVSESLKTFRLMESGSCTAIEISCPNLEKVELLGQISRTSLKFKDLPPSVCVILGFRIQLYADFVDEDDYFRLVKEILLQVQHVKELKIGSWISMMKGFEEARPGEIDESLFDRLMSHLKTVEIERLSYCGSNDDFANLLKFLKFILKNARVLEKMILLEPGQEMDFALKVCQNLSSVQKSSPVAVVEVACLQRACKEDDWNEIVC